MQLRREHSASAVGGILGLAAIIIGGVLFGTLTPMPYDRVIPSVSFFQGYRYISFEPTSFKDVIGNVLLYMPVGVIFWCVARGVFHRRITALPMACLAAIAMSVSIEWAQVFIPGRYPSIVDVCMNGIGACFGAITATIVTAMARTFLLSINSSTSTVEMPADNAETGHAAT